jgi:hypothetical protein
MTDLDTLRRALQSRDDPTVHDDLDVSSIVARGRRMRFRRRLAATGGAVGIAGAVLAVALGTTQLTGPSLTPGQPPVAPGHILSPATTPAPSPPVPRSTTAPALRPATATPAMVAPTTTPTAFSTPSPQGPTKIPGVAPFPTPTSTSAVGSTAVTASPTHG